VSSENVGGYVIRFGKKSVDYCKRIFAAVLRITPNANCELSGCFRLQVQKVKLANAALKVMLVQQVINTICMSCVVVTGPDFGRGPGLPGYRLPTNTGLLTKHLQPKEKNEKNVFYIYDFKL